MIPDFYTVGEMAQLLRVRPGTLRNRLWRNAPGLPTSILVGGRRLFPRPEYEAWKRGMINAQIDAQTSRRA